MSPLELCSKDAMDELVGMVSNLSVSIALINSPGGCNRRRRSNLVRDRRPAIGYDASRSIGNRQVVSASVQKDP